MGYLFLIQEFTSILGHNFFSAKNGKEALKILQHQKIDIVLMDIEMPVLNGLDTTVKIRKELKLKTPVVVITAHDKEYFEEKLRKYGFDDYISKDCTMENIQEKIQKFCPALQ